MAAYDQLIVLKINCIEERFILFTFTLFTLLKKLRRTSNHLEKGEFYLLVKEMQIYDRELLLCFLNVSCSFCGSFTHDSATYNQKKETYTTHNTKLGDLYHFAIFCNWWHFCYHWCKLLNESCSDQTDNTKALKCNLGSFPEK